VICACYGYCALTQRASTILCLHCFTHITLLHHLSPWSGLASAKLIPHLICRSLWMTEKSEFFSFAHFIPVRRSLCQRYFEVVLCMEMGLSFVLSLELLNSRSSQPCRFPQVGLILCTLSYIGCTILADFFCGLTLHPGSGKQSPGTIGTKHF
jgi:hypothetical protein